MSHALMEFVRFFVPSPKQYRDLALDEGVQEGRFTKVDGVFKIGTSKITEAQTEEFLADSVTYQTWRLLANMKELLVETISHVLARKYGCLDQSLCKWLLTSTDLAGFVQTGEIREVAKNATVSDDLAPTAVISRIAGLLKYVGTQFWEEKRNTLLSTSRIRTVLIKREVAAEFKKKVWETEKRKTLDKPWKAEGRTFLESLPKYPLPKKG